MAEARASFFIYYLSKVDCDSGSAGLIAIIEFSSGAIKNLARGARRLKLGLAGSYMRVVTKG
jgi:hypothetical protein